MSGFDAGFSSGFGEPETPTELYVPLSEFLHKSKRSEAALLAGNNYEGELSDVEPPAEALEKQITPVILINSPVKRVDKVVSY